jgi:predicted ATPase
MPIVEMLLFPNEYRCFKPMATILFNPGVNLLVGSNGSGKSMVLGAICAHAKLKKAFWKRDLNAQKHSVLVTSKDETNLGVFAHDFEYDSARTAISLETHGMLPMETIVHHSRMSHGQATMDIILALEGAKKPGIIILDEPDTGLSPGAARKLSRALKHQESIGSQVIASVHNPWVIEEFERVWDMDKMTFRSGQEYLDEQWDMP